MITPILLLSLFFSKPFCSCLPLDPIDDKQYNSYALIAKGKVVKDTIINYERLMTFEVDTYYKGGGDAKVIEISTASQDAMCGINPGIGDEWLMFAYGSTTKYTTGLCTRSKSIDSKVLEYNKEVIKADLKFLNEKKKMTASQSPQP